MKTPENALTDEDILQRLLSSEDSPEKTVQLERIGIPITMRGLSGKEVFQIKDRYTHTNEKRGKTTKVLDEEGFNCGLIAAATVKPNWGDAKLVAKYKASGPEEVIKRRLLAGELAQLGDVVLDISGFNTELEEIKN